mgnify:FL=1
MCSPHDNHVDTAKESFANNCPALVDESFANNCPALLDIKTAHVEYDTLLVVPADKSRIRKLNLEVDPKAVEWYNLAVQSYLFWFCWSKVVDNKCPVLYGCMLNLNLTLPLWGDLAKTYNSRITTRCPSGRWHEASTNAGHPILPRTPAAFRNVAADFLVMRLAKSRQREKNTARADEDPPRCGEHL